MEEQNAEGYQILFSDYDDSSSNPIYESPRDAERYVDNFLDSLGITRKVFGYQSDRLPELDRVTPLSVSRWHADQNLFDAFQNAFQGALYTSPYGVTVGSPAKGTLVFGHQ